MATMGIGNFRGIDQMPGRRPSPPNRRPVGVDPFTDYKARLFTHDVMMNGYPRGTIYGQVLLNPEGSGQGKIFLDTPIRRQWFGQALSEDMQDDGVINGSSLRRAQADSYWQATGHDIRRAMFSAPLVPADFSRKAIFKPGADPMKPGGLEQIIKDSGVSGIDLLKWSLWGHNASENRVITNPGTQQFANRSLTDRTATDYFFVNARPEYQAYTRTLINNPRAGDQSNQDFLGVMSRLLRVPQQFFNR